MNADGLGSNLQNGTTLGAFHDGDATCDAGGVASRDVWYALVPDFPYTVFLEVKSTAFDPVVAIYDIFCGPEIACNDNCSAASGNVAGLTFQVDPGIPIYWIRVSDQGMGTGGPFTIRAIQASHAPPPNNDCDAATVIPSGASTYTPVPYSTAGAIAPCAEPNESCDNGNNVSNSVWYSFSPDTDGIADLNTIGSDYDTVLAVFTGTCVNASQIACDDDGGGVAGPSVITGLSLSSGTTYLIKASEWSTGGAGSQLDFNLTFVPESVPEQIQVSPVIVSTLAHQHLSIVGNTVTRDAVTFPCSLGACDGPGFSASIGQGDFINMRFAAPPGQKFQVTLQPGGTQFFFYNARWSNGLGDTGSNFISVPATFENLVGTPPTGTFNQHGVFNAGNALKCIGDYTVTGSFSFTAINLQFEVTHPVPELLRTYGVVNSSSAPSFGSSRTVPGTAADAVLMQIVPVCNGNVDGNGVVNVGDLLAVIGAWGPCADPNVCPADIAPPGGNDVVNVQDLLAVIGAWGACP